MIGVETVRYGNASEGNITRFTERSVRKLVKLFSIDEHQVQEDLAKLQHRIDRIQGVVEEDRHTGDSQADQGLLESDEQVDLEDELVIEEEEEDPPAVNTRSRRRRCNCCCLDHCCLSFHTLGPLPQAYLGKKISSNGLDQEPTVVGCLEVEEDWTEEEPVQEELDTLEEDSLYGVLTSLNLVM